MNLSEYKYNLVKSYPYRIELHAHTSPASSCGRATPEQVVSAYRDIGFDGIVIDNHFLYQNGDISKNEYIERYLDDFYRAEACGKELGIKVYLGAEIRFTENFNDYLVFGVNRDLLDQIYDLLPFGLSNFRKELSLPDSLLIQAHPNRDNIEPVDPMLLDGIEIFNMHPNHNSRIGLTSAYAKEKGFDIVTGGSDFHHPNRGHEGLSAMRVATLPEDSFGIARFLKDGEYLLEFAGERIVLP